MEKIYQGGEFSVPILSENVVDMVVFYNKATKHKVDANVQDDGENEDGLNKYTITLSAEQTKEMPIGIYDIEVVRAGRGGEPIMDYQKSAYAEVCESSLSQRG